MDGDSLEFSVETESMRRGENGGYVFDDAVLKRATFDLDAVKNANRIKSERMIHLFASLHYSSLVHISSHDEEQPNLLHFPKRNNQKPFYALSKISRSP